MIARVGGQLIKRFKMFNPVSFGSLPGRYLVEIHVFGVGLGGGERYGAAPTVQARYFHLTGGVHLTVCWEAPRQGR